MLSLILTEEKNHYGKEEEDPQTFKLSTQRELLKLQTYMWMFPLPTGTQEST